jgi:CDP-paratose 2-epimerase
MGIVLITGSNGLIGSESVKFFIDKGFKVIGIDNDMRSYFFGEKSSTKPILKKLYELKNYEHYNIDIRNFIELENIFKIYKNDIKCIIHTAAQPSHDWAAKEPLTDFTINANGTLNLLELTRLYTKEVPFIYTSTNKVYGDNPNKLPLDETKFRYEIDSNHPFFLKGIDESMSIDYTKHSLFGVSKLSGDILVQEYGKYFNMNTVCFRGGCLTGPQHKGAELHGFLSYIIKAAIDNIPYTIYGYKGKQVRDNIHSYDLVNAFWFYFQNPKMGEVYNIGGSRKNSISILETIDYISEKFNLKLNYTLSEKNREGDHIWYISDVSKFKKDYPNWEYQYELEETINEIYYSNKK